MALALSIFFTMNTPKTETLRAVWYVGVGRRVTTLTAPASSVRRAGALDGYHLSCLAQTALLAVPPATAPSVWRLAMSDAVFISWLAVVIVGWFVAAAFLVWPSSDE